MFGVEAAEGDDWTCHRARVTVVESMARVMVDRDNAGKVRGALLGRNAGWIQLP